MNGRARTRHVADLLPAYINGTLGSAEEWRVREHLQTCAGCRGELAAWEAIEGATEAAVGRMPEPPQRVMDEVRARISREKEAAWSPSSRLSLLWQLLVGQIPLVRKEIWTASAATMAVGLLVALLLAAPGSSGAVVAVFAPIIAAIGVAFIYGPENDPFLEVALSTPTPPRLVLLARLTLVYGYDLALTLAATALLAIIRESAGLWPLISLWIGPMFFLSALALLLSLFFGTTAASLAAMGLWGVRLMAEGGARSGLDAWEWAAPMQSFWQATSLLLALAAVLFAVAILYGPHQGRTVQEGRG